MFCWCGREALQKGNHLLLYPILFSFKIKKFVPFIKKSLIVKTFEFYEYTKYNTNFSELV